MVDRDSELIRLAAYLSSRPINEDSYKLEELLAGLSGEKERLGQRKYLVLLDQHVIDIDGLTKYEYLLESFMSKSEAIAFIDATAIDLSEQQTAGVDENGDTWVLESEGGKPWLSKPKTIHKPDMLQVLYEKSYRYRASIYDTKYICFRLLGKFHLDVVSERLFSYVNEDFALWSFFVDIGSSIEKQAPDRKGV